MPLNYSKWDNLELSDDSDVEVHPNVDKKSFIRWKQRDIHEKREIRKAEHAGLLQERANNEVLIPAIDKIRDVCKSEGHSGYSREYSRLQAGRAERGNKDGPDGPTHDDMLLSLLLQVNMEPGVQGKAERELDDALHASMDTHSRLIRERQGEIEQELRKMEEEDKRKITSEGIKEGWSAGHTAKPEPAAAPPPAKKATTTTATTTTQIETINTPSKAASGNADSDDDDEEVPTLTDDMKALAALPSTIPSFIPVHADVTGLPSGFNAAKHVDGAPFEVAYKFLGAHRALLPEGAGTTDALLIEAFHAQMRGQADAARRCTEKALMVQYCNKLGKDGLSLFFKRMTGTDGKAAVVYFNDVLSTYSRIARRAAEMSKEDAFGSASGGTGGTEQIQLVAEDPATVISFEVPDGPPPEHLELEGEGSEGMDVDKVRAFLQRRWDIFQAFAPALQDALGTRQLASVNKVLGEMECDEAEKVVALLDEAGIMNFSRPDVVDTTKA